MTYNIVTWKGSFIANIRKITISVNKIIRTILGVKFINHLPILPTSKSYKALDLLKLDDVYRYYLLLFIHSFLYGSNFEIFMSKFLPLMPNHAYNVKNLDIHLPNYRINVCR